MNLKELAGYLPYRLRMMYDFENGTQWVLDVTNINAITKHDKPILRPMSDLTKEIEVNGEKFVPLIELYRMSNKYNYDNELYYDFIDSWVGKGDILKVYHNRQKDEYTEFIFSKGSFRKDTKYSKGSYNFGMTLPHDIRCNSEIYNQYKLFQFLYKHHFDIYGLIEKGEAIDINTIEK